MSFADDLAELTAREPVLCKTGAWIAGRDEEDRAAIEAHLARGGSVSHLWRAAVRNGCDAAETRFRTHCRQLCSCYRGTVTAA